MVELDCPEFGTTAICCLFIVSNQNDNMIIIMINNKKKKNDGGDDKFVFANFMILKHVAILGLCFLISLRRRI